MSDLQPAEDQFISSLDVEERGNSLRVATNTPHLISLGCGRLSTAVTIHPLRQGGVSLGSDPSSNIVLQGTGVYPEHCKIENSNGVVTLYPITGDTLIDGIKVDTPSRLSQGCMIGIGRSNYLRFNHPEEANLMKSVLPNTRISMAPIQFLPNENYTVHQQNTQTSQNYNTKEIRTTNNSVQNQSFNNPTEEKDRIDKLIDSLNSYKGQSALDNELDMINKEIGRRKPPVAPRRMYRDLDQTSNSSNSDQEAISQRSDTPPKTSSIMSKVSKFEYYVKNSQRNVKSPNTNEIWSPKVFSANSSTMNTPAKDVLNGKNLPLNYPKNNQSIDNGVYNGQKKVYLNENNVIEARNCSYTNVTIKNQAGKVDQLSKSFDGYRNVPTSIPLNQQCYNGQNSNKSKIQTPSPSFNRNPVFNSSVKQNSQFSSFNESSVNAYNGPNEDECQRFLEQSRIDEILNMCAEYEKQNSSGVPTTPTEKKTHNKIITNGSLPRGFQNNSNIVQSSDGYFRFETNHRPDRSPVPVPNSPDYSKSSTSASMNYENAKSFQQSNSNNNLKNHQQIPTHHLNFENVQPEVQMVTAYRQENFVQNVRQFPITELSSPVMIRKIARNAQNSANYIGSHDSDRTKMFISPYENVSPTSHGFIISGVSPSSTYTPKSPGSNSPRTRIKTTYAHRNPPQHFVFPSPPPTRDNDGSKCPGIEKQLSLTEDIPMIDDTNFANELEMRIARLKPENREIPETIDKFILDPLESVYGGGHRRNFEEIKRDLIADIPELDAIQKDLDRDLSKTSISQVNNSSNSENLKELSETLKDIPLEDEVFEKSPSPIVFEKRDSLIESSVTTVDFVNQSTQAIIHTYYEKQEDFTNKIDTIIPQTIPVENDVEKRKSVSSIKTSDSTKNSISEDNELKQEPVNKPPESECKNEKFAQLEELYSLRKQIMNDMKDIKTEIHESELSRKQSQAELDEFEFRMETLQDKVEAQKQLRKDEIDGVSVSESEKMKFKIAQEERQAEMKEMQKKLETAEEQVKKVEKDFSKGQATLEELRHAQEMLENERKLFEDMEFQHLEKESEFFSRLSKEHNVVQNDPLGTSRKIERLEKLIQEMKLHEMSISEKCMKENNDAENPILKQLLEDLTKLENNLSSVNQKINNLKREMGIFRNVDRNNDIENYKARVRSGDFSPPTSDEDDMNEIKDRVRSSVDQMSMSMIVETQTNISDLCDNSFSNSSNIIKEKPVGDQMSSSMIVDTKFESKESQDVISYNSNRHSSGSVKAEENSNSEKKGFWERNFDSLSRLKNKDKKSKNKSQDLMSQSLNENMFYNNDNIESEYGSFEKFNTLSNKKTKDKDSKDSPKSMISSLTNLSKIMRKDSLGKKNKDVSKGSDDKENVDINVEMIEKPEDVKDVDNKNSKHRYLKNNKNGSSDNKYTNKSLKSQHSQNNSQFVEEKSKDSSNQSNGLPEEDRYSYADSLEDYRVIDSSGNTIRTVEAKNKIAYRKSDGDEMKKYTEHTKSICDNAKIPSQDDIDRISKITLDSPLFNNGDMNNTLGRKTLDSLRELERNRVAVLEQQGCQVIENEREKISELKKRVQNETMQRWEANQIKQKLDSSNESNTNNSINTSIDSKSNNTTYSEQNADSTIENETFRSDIDYESIPGEIGNRTSLDGHLLEKQLRNSQTDSHNSSAYIEDERSPSRNDQQSSPVTNFPMVPLGHVANNVSRPLSEMSDMSSENGASSQLVEAPRRSRKVSSNSLNSSFGWGRNREDLQRPLTRYLPIDNDELDLRQHIESAGHQVDICPHVIIDSTSCRGYLHKLGAKFHGWSKRWFVFDRSNKTLIYYSDKNEKKPRGGAYFQVIEEVYMDHLNASKSPTPLTTFVIKTRQRRYYLMAPSGPAARIWIDVVFTGAQGYTEYLQ